MPRHCIPYLLIFLFLQGCATDSHRVRDGEKIETESVQLQESQLLDVGILLFEQGEDTETEKNIHEDIRAAESRYMAYHLKETLERAHGWGAVRVLPAASHIADVTVQGTLLASDGEKLEVRARVSDSTGALWFEKVYKAEVDETTYLDVEPGDDVYQHVYNRIANDMSRHRKKLSDRERTTIRNTSEMRYAAGVSPDPFSEYLAAGRTDRTAQAAGPRRSHAAARAQDPGARVPVHRHDQRVLRKFPCPDVSPVRELAQVFPR